LPPVESWRGTSPIQAAKSRPDRNTVGSAAVATIAVAPRTPQNPDARDGLNPPAHLVRAVLGYDFGLGSSGKLDFGPLLHQPWHGNSSLKMAAPARDRTLKA
jgi:hypothetical protein